MKDCKIRSFGILGTADYYYKDAIANLPTEHILVEHADHTMEIPGDAIGSIKTLHKVTQAMTEWLG